MRRKKSMTQGYYFLLTFGFLMIFLVLSLVNIKQLIFLFYFADSIRIKVHEFFLMKVPKESIYSYLITSIFSVCAVLAGTTFINSVKYNNQVNELKKILSSLVEDQVSSIQSIQESLITIRTLILSSPFR
jgi:hypothetical protein